MNITKIIIFISLVVSGCVSVDYSSPKSGPTANLSIKSDTETKDQFNIPVLVHTDECNYQSSQLAGLINSKTVGIEKSDSVNIDVTANSMVSLSVGAILDESFFILPVPIPGAVLVSASANTKYCRPIVDFYAEEGSDYSVTLKSDNGKCYYDIKNLTKPEIPTVSNIRDCELPYSRVPKPSS